MTHYDSKMNHTIFEADPKSFLENAIKRHCAENPNNRLEVFAGAPIFDEPLVGFADGDDTIFKDYETLIGNSHLTPREVWAKYLAGQGIKEQKQPPKITVISWIMPITKDTRLSQRQQSKLPSPRWNHTRWQGQRLINELARYLVSLLENLGYHAIAPESADFYEVLELAEGGTSNWSQRHIAYAAGLGTFSLNDGFITPKGIAMRCGSIVCDVDIAPTPRAHKNHQANCLFYREGNCHRCIERCPVGAISENGHDKKRCAEFLLNEQKTISQQLGRERDYIGRYPGCGLCQTNVPCEDKIPKDTSTKVQKG